MREDASAAVETGGIAEIVSERTLAYLLLGFTMVVWGGSFVAARAILAPENPNAATLTPAVLAALRYLLAAVLFVPPLVARWTSSRRRTKAMRRLDRGDLLRLLGLGQVGIAAYFWLQYTGVRLTNAGVASILVVGLIPISTALVARMRLAEPLRAAHIAALVLGLLGVIVITAQNNAGIGFDVSGSFAIGALALVANAGLFAIYSTLVRGMRERFDALTMTAGTTSAGALGLFVLAALTGGWREIGSLSGWQWFAVVYLALICSVLAYFFYNWSLSVLEASRAASWVYLEPPVALILGAVLLDETITVTSILGGLIIGAAVVLISRAK